jgi:Protein of unknown function (DUF1549)/Protein of unknown function (DUF1553)
MVEPIGTRSPRSVTILRPQRNIVLILFAGGAYLVASASAGPQPATVSFRTQVLPVLSKSGCNAGTCHGNANGKAGFKLSLRGQDPGLDHLALTRDAFARRTNPFDPDQSLILLKATTQISHEGGLRFRKDSAEYALLRRWISEGTPDDEDTAPRLVRLEVSPLDKILTAPDWSVALSARAVFSDGTSRDVTSQAIYEPSVTWANVSHDGLVQTGQAGETTVIVRFLQLQVPVRLAFIPHRPDFAWSQPRSRNLVDEHVFARLQTLRINPSELCPDHEFVRRAYFDLLGIPPPGAEARAFVEDSTPDKRSRLVDTLLERPEFSDFWALKWADLLRNEEKVLDRKGVQTFHHWIRQSIAENKPLDQFARELISARGSTYENPPANFYRALRDPISRAEATAQVFLGTRLLCAKCHNHPFDRWTQADYYDWANLFARVQYKVLENQRRDSFDKHEFNGEQVVWLDRHGSVTNPKTGRAASSRFLDMTGLSDANPAGQNSAAETWGPSQPAPGQDPLQALAQWVTRPDNPLFARVQVNRVWFHLLGRGIVEPIDDFRPTNPASNPELIEALTRDFVASGFDLRHLIRRITNSRTYQLSSQPNETNAQDQNNFSHAYIRRLSAEQLLDAQCRVLGVEPHFRGYPPGMRAGQVPALVAGRRRGRSPSDGDMFLKLFGKPDRILSCECERSDETTMSQAFQLISGPMMNDFLTEPDNRLGALIASGRPPRQWVGELYWSALSRAPVEKEMRAALSVLNRADNPRSGLEDIAWALLNTKEFVLRQ